VGPTRPRAALPLVVLALAIVAMAWHGPIPQLANYHDFADRRAWSGVPNAADVLSNLAFAIVAAWAWLTERPGQSASTAERRGRAAFIASLLLTTIGSGWYHLAPDNARLVFDRVPIALACAALLCAMHARAAGAQAAWVLPASLAAAIGSVAWWMATEASGRGDLRPYLLLQAATLVFVPLWQWLWGRPARERALYGVAVALYVAAKVFEVADARVFEVLGAVSGHTIKHLCAAAAIVFIMKSMRPAT
jgi:hypothetical protein